MGEVALYADAAWEVARPSGWRKRCERPAVVRVASASASVGRAPTDVSCTGIFFAIIVEIGITWRLRVASKEWSRVCFSSQL